MANYYAIITDIGNAQIANAIALRKTISLTHMAVGDANGSSVLPVPNQKKLVHETYRAQINQLTIDEENPNVVICEFIIPEDVGGFYVRELGVFDSAGNLVAVGNTPESYKPKMTEGSGAQKVMRMHLVTSASDKIELKINPSIVVATIDLVNKKVDEINQKIATKADKNHNHDTVYAKITHSHTIANVTDLQNVLNGKSPISHEHSDLVPTTRKINNKALSTDVVLTASDVGAASSAHNHDNVYAKASHSHNYLPLDGGEVSGKVLFGVKAPRIPIHYIQEKEIASYHQFSKLTGEMRAILGIISDGIDIPFVIGRYDEKGNIASRLYLNTDGSVSLNNLKIGANLAIGADGRLKFKDVELANVNHTHNATDVGAFAEKGSLQNVNINTLCKSTDTGVYYNENDSNATPERGFPFQEAGSLLIQRTAYGCQQMYISFRSNRVFLRGLSGPNNGSGPWYPWKELSQTSHSHTTAQISGLDNALASKAPANSPAFTGTPQAPTQPVGDNTTKLATTAFVQVALNALPKVDLTPYLKITDAENKFAFKSITVNGQPLSKNVNLLAGDVNAFNKTESDARYALSARKINNKPLTADISLTASDVGAAPTSHTHTTAQVSGLDTALASKASTNHTHTDLSKTDASNITVDSYLAKLGLKNAALTVNGWQKLPNGLIIQWGVSPSTAADNLAINFPIAFPTACFVVSHSKTGTGRDTRISGVTTTGFTSLATGPVGSNYYIAIGY